jgi:zinc transport system substrate-binding protein
MRALNAAQLLVWVGPELTPGLDTARQSAPDLQSLALFDDPATLRQTYADGGPNPHAWLDPTNASLWLGLIAQRLSALDPDNAATYAANAATGQAQIAAMDADIARQLAPLTQTFVTYHDAYGYFTNRYDLHSAGGLAAGDAAPPGAARLSDLRAQAEAGEIMCAFPETQHDPALITNLAAGTALFVGPPLDPVGSTLDPTPQAYAQLMTTLTQSLLTCANKP